MSKQILKEYLEKYDNDEYVVIFGAYRYTFMICKIMEKTEFRHSYDESYDAIMGRWVNYIEYSGGTIKYVGLKSESINNNINKIEKNRLLRFECKGIEVIDILGSPHDPPNIGISINPDSDNIFKLFHVGDIIDNFVCATNIKDILDNLSDAGIDNAIKSLF